VGPAHAFLLARGARIVVERIEGGGMDTSERVAALAAPVCRRAGVELVDVEYKPPTLRVTIDRPGGVDIGAIRDVTRALSNVLDDEDPISGRYTLEVSSPGLERPLRTPDHFRRAVGSDVLVRTRDDVDGERRVRGVLRSADDDGIELADVEAPEVHRRLRYDEILKAKTVFEWGPAPKPGQPRRPRSAPGMGTATNPQQPAEEP
jgi:ribosome maturation factor RimP